MKIATWNVNSVRARQERLLAWLEKTQPDVVCLQELKVTTEAFPADVFRERGYHAAVHGQKTYNGVAILSRTPLRQVQRGLADDDPQARLLGAEIEGVFVLSAYVPNGQAIGSDKYAYKLEWLARLEAFLTERFTPSTPLLLCGDFNVARDDLDVAQPQHWADSVLCHADARNALERIVDWGLVDIFREHHPDGGVYSWWDYRQLAFPKNHGLRIDHIFATRPLAERCSGSEIDRAERKGEKPSDHAPVIAVFGP